MTIERSAPAAPPASALRWAERAVGADAAIVAVDALRPDGGTWRLRIRDGDHRLEAVLKAQPSDWIDELTSEATALGFAEEHGLPAPRLLGADLTGVDAGTLAVLLTMLPGTTDIPMHPSSARLRMTGAAAAALHRVPLRPRPGLPHRARHMPWIDYDEERRRGELTAAEGSAASFALLETASAVRAAMPTPDDVHVFVHGDLWQGNILWAGDEYVGIIDWEAGGSGHYGVDLGALRLDAALLHGPDAPAEVLAGWEAATGARADGVPYWDLVSALNTPADMCDVAPSMHQAGRTDLNGTTLTTRRDDFLRVAIDRARG